MASVDNVFGTSFEPGKGVAGTATRNSFVRDLIAGGMSGIIAKTIGNFVHHYMQRKVFKYETDSKLQVRR